MFYSCDVEFCAHGYYVYSTDITVVSAEQISYTYSPRAGTSMAAPQVAAVAAVLWSHFPHCTDLDIRAALAKTAKPHAGANGCNEECGFGIVQLRDAFNLLNDVGCSGIHNPPVLSISRSTCDCIDGGACRIPVATKEPEEGSLYLQPQPIQASPDPLPLCKDNKRLRFSFGRAKPGRMLQNKRKRNKKRRGCKNIRAKPDRAKSWCRWSSGAKKHCKDTCSSYGVVSYPDCRPRNGPSRG